MDVGLRERMGGRPRCSRWLEPIPACPLYSVVRSSYLAIAVLSVSHCAVQYRSVPLLDIRARPGQRS